MKMVKCPSCNGNGSYMLTQNFWNRSYTTPVKCRCDNGKISWSEFCIFYRKRSKKRTSKVG